MIQRFRKKPNEYQVALYKLKHIYEINIDSLTGFFDEQGNPEVYKDENVKEYLASTEEIDRETLLAIAWERRCGDFVIEVKEI